MDRYLTRLADPLLRAHLQNHAAVMVTGPRACGKTTTAIRLARSVVRLDVPAQAAAFRADPDASLAAIGKRPVLIDEWQEVPDVIGAVKRAVDSGAPAGSYILTGSVRAEIEQASWAGTGRIVEVRMGPLTVREMLRRADAPGLIERLSAGGVPAGSVPGAPDLVGYLDLALAGGFPEPALALPQRARAGWYDTYVTQTAARDVLGILRRADPDRVRTYMEAYALNSAGVADHATLFTAAGINRKTADGYDAVLGRLYLAEPVPAWSGNRLARLVGMPKRFMADTAVMAAAARVTRADILADGDLLGRVIEAFVFAQLRPEIAVGPPGVRLHHVRTEKGRNEVDLLVDLGGRRVIGLEVKAGASPDARDARHLRWLREHLGDAMVLGAVLHTGPAAYPLGDRIMALPICCLWSA